MRQLIRWYEETRLRLRCALRRASRGASAVGSSEPPPARGRKRILMVCHANLCRGPFTAGLLRTRLEGAGWQVLSAGVDAVDDKPVAAPMRAAAAEFGVDLRGHCSRRVTRNMLRTSDLVIAMSHRQLESLLQLEPSIRRRVRLLGGFDPQPAARGVPVTPPPWAAADTEIPDPSGEDLEFHRECCRRLDGAVGHLSRWVLRREASRTLPAPRPPLSAPALRAARLR
jgi:protein-tyrosine phosphatase